MSYPIIPSQFNTVPAITYYNTALHRHGCLVFRSAQEANKEYQRLSKLEHLRSVQLIDASVK